MSKRAFQQGHWNHDGEAVPLVRSGGDRAADLEWRAQADEGGCADWGISWAFEPTPPQMPEPLGREHAIVAAITVLSVISITLLILFDKGLISWPAL